MRDTINRIYFALNKGDKHFIVSKGLFAQRTADIDPVKLAEALAHLKTIGRVYEDWRSLKWIKEVSMLETLYP